MPLWQLRGSSTRSGYVFELFSVLIVVQRSEADSPTVEGTGTAFLCVGGELSKHGLEAPLTHGHLRPFIVAGPQGDASVPAMDFAPGYNLNTSAMMRLSLLTTSCMVSRGP